MYEREGGRERERGTQIDSVYMLFHIRRASTMWHWPYCVCVGEKTFKHLLTLLTKYGDVSEEQLPLPFTEKRYILCTNVVSECVYLTRHLTLHMMEMHTS